MKPRNDLTADRLRELLSYDAETGVFYRKIALCNSVKPGDIAGSDDGEGYIRIRVDGVTHRAHRLAWLYVTGAWPAEEIDHINGNRGDNRIANLREATHAENGQNRAIPRNSRSKRHGVGWDKKAGKWRARIKSKGVEVTLGHFANIEDAVQARAKAKAELHQFQPTERTGAQP